MITLKNVCKEIENCYEVHFYKEGFVLNKNSSSTDILRWDMSVLFAKSYVSALSENVKRGNRYALESGQYPGKPPIGYQKVPIDNGKPTFILYKTRVCLIKKIFELYSEGIYAILEPFERLHLQHNVCKLFSDVIPPLERGTM